MSNNKTISTKGGIHNRERTTSLIISPILCMFVLIGMHFAYCDCSNMIILIRNFIDNTYVHVYQDGPGTTVRLVSIIFICKLMLTRHLRMTVKFYQKVNTIREFWFCCHMLSWNIPKGPVPGVQ